MKKYKLTDSVLWHRGHKLRRILAQKDFSDIKKGDFGGWVESERNLSQDGNCWIYDDGKCYGYGLVDDDAKVYNSAEVFDEGLLCESAVIKNYVQVCGTTTVESNAVVSGYAILNNQIITEDLKKERIATFLSGCDFIILIQEKRWTPEIKSIKKAEQIPSRGTKLLYVSEDNSVYPIVMWNEGSVLYWYSEADAVFFHENSYAMFSMFDRLSDISGLSEIRTDHVKDMSLFFYNCRSLSDLSPIENWDVSHVENFAKAFINCSIVSTDAFHNWDVSQCSNFNSMFRGCGDLSDLQGLGSWNVSKAKDMSHMFGYCYEIQNLDALQNWDMTSVENTSFMFYGCESLSDIDGIKEWNFSHVEQMKNMFVNCKELKDQSVIHSWDPKVQAIYQEQNL